MKKLSSLGIAAIAVAALIGAGTSPAQADDVAHHHHVTTPTVLAKGLVTPLRLAANGDGSVVVAQEFAGMLTRVARNGAKTTIYSAPGWDVGGVSISDGKTYFVQSQGAGGMDGKPLAGFLKSIDKHGKVRQIANIAAYIKAARPGKNVTFGFRDLKATCLAQVPAQIPGSYKQELDSHPYATDEHDGTIYIADAGANAILKVNEWTGHVSTAALLPGRPIAITKALAAGMHLPTCAIGHKYYLEPVPTDVQRGHDGWLYVTSLPGGPEDGSLGANGSVFKVNPWNGQVRVVARHLAGASGLALARNGDIYVAELFAGRISVIRHCSDDARPFLAVKAPGDVEIRGGTLYATIAVVDPTNPAAPPAGQVIKVSLER
ncbi:ScyD/ScyE family protein [Paenarthrobacter sp. Z7-10]|uniref:ScyD/ScyE family protein n=1 Tax=Paenarthrobacter sp. Z7-10 TaxID=2787635 RepID=UPI0022A940B2|nr:ScyD/ScyE family protein [Paenarthrobacter sp. Z7-10]MCZ2404189.1 ScyD/ScyE family protein [Paenarthrobacter sp. Z7-10]